MTNALESAQASFKLAMEAGVKIAMGTDLPARADHLREMEFMHGLGMDARDVWRAATLNGAEMLGRDDLGSLTVGSRADVVGIAGDVDDFAGLSQRVRLVLKDGKKVDL